MNELNMLLIKNVSSVARCQIGPLTIYWGAIIAKEIVSFVGKYWPVKQFYHFDIFETRPSENVNFSLNQCRYDDVIAIYGNELWKKLSDMKC